MVSTPLPMVTSVSAICASNASFLMSITTFVMTFFNFFAHGLLPMPPVPLMVSVFVVAGS